MSSIWTIASEVHVQSRGGFSPRDLPEEFDDIPRSRHASVKTLVNEDCESMIKKAKSGNPGHFPLSGLTQFMIHTHKK